MLQIQTTKTNGSNPDNKNKWFKSRQQKPRVPIQTAKTMFQIQKTKNNGENPDNKNQTSGSNHGLNVAFKLMFKIQPIKK